MTYGRGKFFDVPRLIFYCKMANTSAHAAHLQAEVAVDFLVGGGGLAGLACAYALGRSGHKVRVLEAAPSLNQVRSLAIISLDRRPTLQS